MIYIYKHPMVTRCEMVNLEFIPVKEHQRELRPVPIRESKGTQKPDSQLIAKPATNPCFYFPSTFNLLRATGA
jgi:hypothetical protein